MSPNDASSNRKSAKVDFAGLGIGLLASMAYDPLRDANLAMLEAGHLFPVSTTYLGLRRDAYLRGYVYDFIEMLAPHNDRKAVDAALKGG